MATIPSSLRLQGHQEKYILREAVKDLLPRAIVQRKKSGFTIPVGLWFRNELWSMANDILTPVSTEQSGLLNWDYISQLLNEHKTGRFDHGLKLLGLVTFYQWYNSFVREGSKHNAQIA